MRYPNIEAERARHGLTMSALADKLGVTKQMVSRWRHGKSCPTIKELKQMAEMFNVTVDYLLDEE